MSEEFDRYTEELENDFGLDPEEHSRIKATRMEWYKAEKGRTDRVALVYFRTVDVSAVRVALKKNPNLSPAEKAAVGKSALEQRAKELKKPVDALTEVEKLNIDDVRFKQFRVHYQDGLGYIVSRLGKDGPEADEVWKRLDAPRDYFTTLVLLYPTNRDGELNKRALQEGQWRILPWRIGPDRYLQILKRNKGLMLNGVSIASQDLEITCKDTQYQNISIDIAGPAMYRANKAFRDLVLSKAVEMYDKVSPFKEMSTSDLRIKLGVGSSDGADAGISPDEFNDILTNV